MATEFSALPVISLAPLKASPSPSSDELDALAARFYDTFVTTGFAYLVDYPLSFGDAEVFDLAGRFFALPADEKMKLAKKSFCRGNENTYRGCVLLSGFYAVLCCLVIFFLLTLTTFW